MKTRALGQLQVSVVGLGCNNFGGRIDYDATVAVIDAALDAGINFFDTADTYGGNGKSEEFMGRALKGRRDQVIIATKFGSTMEGAGEGAHPDYIRTAAEASLRRLQTDVIDFYQIHKPDPNVPIADTLGALDELVKAGKVREIGCSNYTADMLRESQAVTQPGAARFESVQNHYSMLTRDPESDGVLAECERQGLAFLPFFPLERGLLTGKFRQGQAIPEGTRLSNAPDFLTEERLAVVEKLITFAEARGHTILELAFSWLLARPTVASVIAGATKPAQIHGNVAAVGWTLSEADLQEIDSLLA